ncbi:DNA polymerase I [Phreatobacter sp. AB_2022a]|uniref:DNA polymerase I n=1 Tax=Phreatobacter sp. AB_2022a TaxID=3003134 RepID=UPI0022874F80|nr:DNA polymerase I [Phreatobacter sp. AB_2022a]MCZ0737485.1 DNA polymerase I [Phreatobacter sp. AB_2022a]
MTADHHRPVREGDRVFLVDASSFVFRSYFQSMNQDRKYNSRSDGLPTGAVRLFATKILQFVQDGALGVTPTHLAMILDKSENSFRKALYPAYKGNRPPPPEDLVPQFPLMRHAIRAFGLLPIEQDTYEADDLIATYAELAKARGADVLIISADKDLMQLVGPRVAFYDPESGIKGKPGYRPERLLVHGDRFERWNVPPDKLGDVTEYWEGLPPEKIIDIQALEGDTSDNVPGAPGIGRKTAAQLIAEYGDVEALLARAGEIKQPKRRETLTDPAVVERVRLSRRLVELVRDVALEVPLDDIGLEKPDGRTLVSFLKAMEFTTITRRVAELYGVDAGAVEADPELAATPGATRPATPAAAPGAAEAAAAKPDTDGAATPEALAARIAEAVRQTPVDRSGYLCITTVEALDDFIAEAREKGVVALDTETTSLDAMSADLVGFSLAYGPGRAAYVPIGHRGGDAGLFDSGLVPDQIPARAALDRLKALAEDPGVLKIGQNLKYDLLILRRHGIRVAPYDDTMLISYVLDGGRGNHGMDALSERHLGHETIAYASVAGTGKNAITFDRVPLDKATAYAAEDADVTLRLWQVLKPRLPAEAKTTVYETLERPLVEVLAGMERRGILIDRQVLARLSGDFAQTAARVEAEIQELAGEPLNPGSPKQLGDILFGKMGLPGGTKTKTGAWSTAAGVLEDLAEEGHALPQKILEWRTVSKLKSTYTDALPTYVNAETGRVHTSFSLAATTTGRLSSSEPNIQNIPVRTEEGRKIRTAFIAAPGRKLVSADYSQIELRVLAHIADIPQLRQAFADGVDIHAMTASEMFGVPVKGMDPLVRRRAKAINFGIIYGISAFGLANQLGIAREEASAYIKKYFERFPGIRDYMDRTKAFCRDNGYVETIFGRRCHFPAIKSGNPSERAFVERQAINAPIQGSAADIIRRAMARMDEALAAARLDGLMLLQVHDELVFEVPDEQVERTLPVVRRVMEEAPMPALQLKVPLAVDARAAANWEEAH